MIAAREDMAWRSKETELVILKLGGGVFLREVRLTRILWSNCTVVGFSKKFFSAGENASRSSGIQRSPIFGKEL